MLSNSNERTRVSVIKMIVRTFMRHAHNALQIRVLKVDHIAQFISL